LKRSIVLLGVAIAILIGPGPAPAFAEGPPFELVDGDRVVLIGGTMIERDQESGYLETRLIRRYPDRSITFRNLGWSGDTVEGPSRAGFGSVEDGYRHLVEHVLALKPTVVIVGYGGVEAFDGPAGLPKFVANLDKLLKAIEPTKARLVILSTTRQEDLGPPLPDPTRHNADLALYRGTLKVEAEKRGAVFVDLFSDLPDRARATPPDPLTDNGIHFTPQGYWRLASAVEDDLFADGHKMVGTNLGSDEPGRVRLDLYCHFPTRFKGLETTPTGLRFKLLDERLPDPPSTRIGGKRTDFDRVIRVSGLKPGRYALKIDDQAIATAADAAWKEGVVVRRGPEFDQVEALRRAIIAKNQLYFYRWRPQNETYLFGFRKHEQGQNAREIPQFDPLVAAKEAEIARLRVPVPHVYELTVEGEVAR
jgi:lysophospholipase L1-like esterase